jgi:hypothetical protein
MKFKLNWKWKLWQRKVHSIQWCTEGGFRMWCGKTNGNFTSAAFKDAATTCPQCISARLAAAGQR